MFGVFIIEEYDLIFIIHYRLRDIQKQPILEVEKLFDKIFMIYLLIIIIILVTHNQFLLFLKQYIYGRYILKGFNLLFLIILDLCPLFII